jgi:hypothetical protein
MMFFVTGALQAAVTDEDIYKQYKLPVLDRAKIMTSLQVFDKGLVKGDDKGKALNSISYVSYVAFIRDALKNPWMEVDTELSRVWMEKIYKLMTFMYKAKYYLEKEKRMNRENRSQSLKTKQNFYIAYKKFTELLKNPEKVDPKRLRQLKKQKKEWLKQVRAKMEKAGEKR